MATVNLRENRGEAIARQFGWVRRLDEHSYKVHSQSGEFESDVMSTELGWLCSCPDHIYRNQKCKHIIAVDLSFILRKVVARQPVVIQPVNPQGCPKCKSESIRKKGIRHNMRGGIQKFQFKECEYFFTVNLGFERMHATPQAITSAMQLYFMGESFRNVQKFLRLQGVNVSHVCVLKWVRKYVLLMQGYVEQITPQVGDTWRTDEMYVKIKGNMKYLFAMMDDETRFRIS